MGSYVGYSQVEMTYENLEGTDNGKTVSKFYNFTDVLSRGNNLGLEFLDSYHEFTHIRIPHNGKLYEQQQFKRNADDSYTLLNLNKTEYRINGFEASNFRSTDFFTSSDFIMAGNINEMLLLEPSAAQFINSGPNFRLQNIIFQFHPYYASRVEVGETTSFQYNENGLNPVVSTQRMFYDNETHYLPTRTETVDSEGNTLSTQTWYADDINQGSVIEGGAFEDYTTIDAFKKESSNPRIGQPIQTLSINNGKKTLIRTNFSNWGNDIYQPFSQQSLKGEQASENTFQDRILAYDYDEFGNPLEFSHDNGPITSYIWGYNKKYIIAKIDNASYQDIANALNTSVNTVKAYTENDLSKIADLRTNLPTALVTTYEYDPLIGITKTTDPRNYSMTYKYDDLNRLIEVKDDQGHIINDYDYNYKGQTN